jgi:hypothetical protein
VLPSAALCVAFLCLCVPLTPPKGGGILDKSRRDRRAAAEIAANRRRPHTREPAAPRGVPACACAGACGCVRVAVRLCAPGSRRQHRDRSGQQARRGRRTLPRTTGQTLGSPMGCALVQTAFSHSRVSRCSLVPLLLQFCFFEVYSTMSRKAEQPVAPSAAAAPVRQTQRLPAQRIDGSSSC